MIQAFTHFSMTHLANQAIILDAQVGSKAAPGTRGSSGCWRMPGSRTGSTFPAARHLVSPVFSPARSLLNRPFCLSTALQGMLLASGDKRMYLLTDPALCTIDNRYGASDFGQDAMTAFLNNHTCGPLCMGLIETPQPPPHRHHWPCTIM